mgnify:CR=1 FL=1
MNDSSPARVKVTNIPQVGIVCRNVQKTVEAFWNILGVGPWSIYEFGSPQIPDLKYHGEPAWGKFKAAVAQTKPIGIELIEPVEGVSIFQDWLDENGEGLHHITIAVEDVGIESIEKEMAHQGFPSIQSGHFGPDTKDCFSYFDMRIPLKTIVKVDSRMGGAPEGAAVYPENPNTISPARIKIPGIKQLGIAVKDVHKTATDYWYLLGIGPWEIREWGNHMLYVRNYNGKPSWGRERLAHAYPGEMELELMQGVEGPSVYQDWVDEFGDMGGALHHLKFLCDDLDEASSALIDAGFPSMQSGYFGDPKEKAGGFNYIEIPPIHCIMEPVHKPKSLPVEPSARIP